MKQSRTAKAEAHQSKPKKQWGPEWVKTLSSVLLGGAISFLGGCWNQQSLIKHQRNQYVIERLRRADELELQCLQDLDNLRRAVLHRRNVDQLPDVGFIRHMTASHIFAQHAPQVGPLALTFSRIYNSISDQLLQHSALESLANPTGKIDAGVLKRTLETVQGVEPQSDTLFRVYGEIADSIDLEIAHLSN